jgi:flagellar biosynthesis protein FliR
MFMTTVAMGFLSKTMPQLNILSIGFAFKIVVVLFFASLSIAASGGVFRTGIYETLVEIRTAFNLP